MTTTTEVLANTSVLPTFDSTPVDDEVDADASDDVEFTLAHGPENSKTDGAYPPHDGTESGTEHSRKLLNEVTPNSPLNYKQSTMKSTPGLTQISVLPILWVTNLERGGAVVY